MSSAGSRPAPAAGFTLLEFLVVLAILGLVFVGVCGILASPWVHLFLHRFHAYLDDDV